MRRARPDRVGPRGETARSRAARLSLPIAVPAVVMRQPHRLPITTSPRCSRAAARCVADAAGARARARTSICDYATLAARVAQLAGALRDGGTCGRATASRSSRATCRPTSRRCSPAGGRVWSPCPVNAKLHPRELAFVLADCGARWAFADAAWQAKRSRGGPTAPSARARRRARRRASTNALVRERPRAELAPRARATIRRGSSTRAARPGGPRVW